LIAYRCGTRWFGHVIESMRSAAGDRTEFRRVAVPQTAAEIEDFARRNGYEIEWDVPQPGGSYPA
jgi:hypothetical protein